MNIIQSECNKCKSSEHIREFEFAVNTENGRLRIRGKYCSKCPNILFCGVEKE